MWNGMDTERESLVFASAHVTELASPELRERSSAHLTS